MNNASLKIRKEVWLKVQEASIILSTKDDRECLLQQLKMLHNLADVVKNFEEKNSILRERNGR